MVLPLLSPLYSLYFPLPTVRTLTPNVYTHLQCIELFAQSNDTHKIASELFQHYITNNKSTKNLQDSFTAILKICIMYPTEGIQ